MLPDFIRYFADTTDSRLGLAALGYLKSLLRIAPVKLISRTGGAATMQPPWMPYDELLITPMVGSYVNVVCTHPSQWAYTQTVHAQRAMFAANDAAGAPVVDESISGLVELYTVGKRNVLLVGKMPITKGDLLTGAKYEAIVCQNVTDMATWKKNAPSCGALHVSDPGVDHLSVRAAVLG